MATQKPIATISYNSESFLRERLDCWVDQHIIQAYQYIKHKGEDGDKDHIHLRIEPNKTIDPMDLTDKLKEYTKDNSKPLGCRPWRPSKEEDWFLYAVHDADYLSAKDHSDKGEKIPYDWREIQVSDGYDLEIAFTRARSKLKHTASNITNRIRSGEDPVGLVLQGENVYHVAAISRFLAGNDYDRAVRELGDLEHRFTSLVEAIEAKGFSVSFCENGSVFLTENPDH